MNSRTLFLLNRFNGFPKRVSKENVPRLKPLKRLGKKIGSPSTWLKPGENENRLPAIAHNAVRPRLGKLKGLPPSCAAAKPLRLLTAHCSLLTLVLLSAFCLLPSASSQNQPPTAQPQPSPTPSPSPSPSPSASPTPPPNLHQWGALTSFHGLPSDRAHAIAQEKSGVTWFATDGGLAMFNGRRTHAVIAEGLPPGHVRALKIDESGAIWIGTDTGAAWMWNGKAHPIKETTGKAITAIITRERDRVLMATENGQILDCRAQLGEVESLEAGQGASRE